MLTRSCKAKGRKACSELAVVMLTKAMNLKPDDILVTPSGVPGDDLRLSPLAQEIFPWNIEVKNVEKLNVWAALEQAEARVQVGKVAPLFFKRNRSRMYACVPHEYLIDLTVENYNLRKQLCSQVKE